MQFHSLSILALATSAAAFRAINSEKRALSSKDETNAGFIPNKGFDAKDQFVDVRPGSGHEFIAPQKGDIRGPCPGLNAAANHGFTSRTGVLSYTDTVNGLGQAYSIGLDASNFLFVFSIFNSGSAISLKWSIGGPMAPTKIGVLGRGLGISNSHNRYEADSSPGRGDAYLHDGNSHSLNLDNYAKLLGNIDSSDNYNMAGMRNHIVQAHDFTIQNNPFGFFGAGFFIPIIAHEFVVAFMSNHSETNIGGTLSRNILNTFFSVSEEKDGTLVWNPGYDSIPQNWYKRPSNNPYDNAAVFGDVSLSILENPQLADLGGNMGKPNSFAGIEIGNLTGGVFNAKELLQGNNLVCFALQGLVFATPGALNTILRNITTFEKLANKVLGVNLDALGCPELASMDYNIAEFHKYPGYTWEQPLQPATTY